MFDLDDETTIYDVVLNDEEQYSVWPVGRPLPAGWRAEGTRGPMRDCIAHIDVVWTDMRPKSVRAALDEQ